MQASLIVCEITFMGIATFFSHSSYEDVPKAILVVVSTCGLQEEGGGVGNIAFEVSSPTERGLS